MDLSAYPAAAKFLCYSLVRTGHSPSTDLISVYSDEERALREESEGWLENAYTVVALLAASSKGVCATRSVEMEWKEIPIAYAGR